MTYKRITMAEAKEIFKTPGDYIIVDVRTQGEFKQRHIPGAICIPNETIHGFSVPELPNRNQVMYVYCRSGNRSRMAALKLASMGYTNVIEFGGILDWTGEIEK